MTLWLDPDTWQRLWAAAIGGLVSVGLRLVIISVAYWLVRKALFGVVDRAMARLETRYRQSDSSGSERSNQRIEDRSGRILTLQTMVKSIAGYALFFVYALTVLQTFEVNITGIVTTAGVAGIAVGLGAQKLVRDAISGFFIVSEDHFGVGDYVTIAAASGVVEELTLRTTRIRDDQGRLWVVPNGDIGFVLNQSRGPVSTTIELTLPSVGDVAGLADQINQLGDELYAEQPALFKEAPRLIGLAGFDANGVTVRVRIAGQPERLADAQMVVRERMRARLIAAGYLPQSAPTA